MNHHTDGLIAPPQAGLERTGTGKPKLAYIDCLRGYAVLMVIMCHTTYAFANLPYPVHLLGAFGWHGVQLFFLASCLTLMMSSTYERDHVGGLRVSNFFIRRFLRIAPMYYVAGVFYCFASSMSGANWTQALAAVTFLNAWHPLTMPTIPDAWQLVPGGWSIGVEFTFYFLFPIFFSLVTSLRRALLLLLVAIIIGAATNSALMVPLTDAYGAAAADNFLYFWIFNQAPVFALGAVVFFVIQKVDARAELAALVCKLAVALTCLCGALLVAIAWEPSHFSHQFLLRPAVPQFFAASIVFSAVIVAFSQKRAGLFVNYAVGAMGKVSFSAYLLHFAVIAIALEQHGATFHLHDQGITAIAAFVACFCLVSLITYFLSLVTFTLVEAPMMRLAKHLTRSRRTARIQEAN